MVKMKTFDGQNPQTEPDAMADIHLLRLDDVCLIDAFLNQTKYSNKMSFNSLIVKMNHCRNIIYPLRFSRLAQVVV